MTLRQPQAKPARKAQGSRRDEARVIAVLRGPLPPQCRRWTVGRVAEAAGLSVGVAGETIRAMRMAGKLRWSEIELSPSLRDGNETGRALSHLPRAEPDSARQEAAAASGIPEKAGSDADAALPAAELPPIERPQAQRDRAPMNSRTLVPIERVRRGQAAVEASDVIRTLKQDWPALWARCAALAAELGCAPGDAAIRAVSAGLECMEAEA